MRTIKIIMALVVMLTAMAVFTSCNQGIVDLHLKFERAIIKLPNGDVLDVKIRKWYDYQNSDQIQVVTKDGEVYLVHSANIALIHD